MQRKQKKVQQFLDALKVGDRVVTTSGIYGQITKISDKSVQLQIADKVRIEVAKAAVGGYQGQEPVAPDAAGPVSRRYGQESSLARHRHPCRRRRCRSGPFYPPQKKVRLGLDLKGGVHLVLRVQTDDALRLETETTMEQLREARGGQGADQRRPSPASSPTRFKVDGVPAGPGRRVPRGGQRGRDALQPRVRRGRAATRFAMKPNIVVQLREDAVEQALQTIERRVNELGVAEPIVARTGAAGDQILVQLPGVTDVRSARRTSSGPRRCSS